MGLPDGGKLVRGLRREASSRARARARRRLRGVQVRDAPEVAPGPGQDGGPKCAPQAMLTFSRPRLSPGRGQPWRGPRAAKRLDLCAHSADEWIL